MPDPRHRATAAAAGLILLLAGLLPQAPALAAGAPRADAARPEWGARRVSRVSVAARDERLLGTLPGRARVAYHPATGRVRMLSGTPGAPLTRALPGLARGGGRLGRADAQRRARGFLRRYGRLFGLRDADRELRVRATATHRLGDVPGPEATDRVAPGSAAARRTSTVVRFAQERGGVPVLGGEVVVQLSAAGEVLSATGEVLPSTASAVTRPRVSASAATRAARAWLARESRRTAALVDARAEGLALYDPRLMGGPALGPRGARLVWQVDVLAEGTARRVGDHRLVLVDALGGQVVTSIGRQLAADRRVCDGRNTPQPDETCTPPFARREGEPPTGIAEVDSAYRLMGVVDGYFRTRFGRDGLDGAGSPMRATVRWCPPSGCPWSHAEWHWYAQAAILGSGWASADDIIGHELTHGVIDHEARLFYHYQSGAINESLADIFGELIDQAYPGGRDTSWTRWKIGEDTPPGVFRDMRDPPRYGDADRVRSPLWHSKASDFGGVHVNSGVGNKAAWLMAAGGAFGGHRVAKLGPEHMARIFYQAMTARLTSASDYLDLADALVGACADLAGTSGISASDCHAVREATLATQMTLLPASRAPSQAPLCRAGKRAADVFMDDLEDPDAGLWRQSRLVGSEPGWAYPPNPNPDPTWDGTWASSGELNLYGFDLPTRSDTAMTLVRPLTIPEHAFLRFEHGFAFDAGTRRYDGGVVEMRVDGGRWRSVGARFTHGGYDGRIADGTGNPLARRRAFTGLSHGWGASRVDLSDLAGRRLKLRFRIGTDRSEGGYGWYIDDVRVYACVRDDDAPVGSLVIDEGAGSTTQPRVVLAIAASDSATWLTTLRVSNQRTLDPRGRLAKAISLPYRERLAWDLDAAVYGGTTRTGARTVYAQVRDAAGNWSAVFSDRIEWLPGG